MDESSPNSPREELWTEIQTAQIQESDLSSSEWFVEEINRAETSPERSQRCLRPIMSGIMSSAAAPTRASVQICSDTTEGQGWPRILQRLREIREEEITLVDDLTIQKDPDNPGAGFLTHGMTLRGLGT